jgi:N-acyl-D-aspartate/D-glutamate deacylase
MGILARIANGPSAATRTVDTANRAEQLGYRDVQTHYEPPTDTHTVTGTPPKVPDSPRHYGR